MMGGAVSGKYSLFPRTRWVFRQPGLAREARGGAASRPLRLCDGGAGTERVPVNRCMIVDCDDCDKDSNG
jgi:hypothetical protein